MQLCLLSVVVVVVACCVETASLPLSRSLFQQLCLTARNRTVEAKQLVRVNPSDTVSPRETTLTQCDNFDDCCESNCVRRAIRKETEPLTFFIRSAITGVERYETVVVEKHFECGCFYIEETTPTGNEIVES